MADYDQRPLGTPVEFAGAPRPGRAPIQGRHVRLEPLDPARHGDALWACARLPGGERTWDYLPYGPFADRAAFDEHLKVRASTDDPLFFAAIDAATGEARGVLSLMSIVPKMGVIEIGHVWFSPALQRTCAATEAIYLLMKEAFDRLGYRRLEWKCNALNAASCRAAERFGLTYEGTFRQHMVWKGRNRDTAWYALIDGDWPAVRRGFEAWLDPGNFTPDGAQRRTLAELRGPAAPS